MVPLYLPALSRAILLERPRNHCRDFFGSQAVSLSRVRPPFRLNPLTVRMRKKRYFYTIYPIQAAALLAVLFPFLRHNNLLEWDFPGHALAVWHLQNNLLPWATGWNPFFYCGYPQGIFYPPAGHYLAALLSFPLGIPLAIKSLVALSFLALPITFYFFSRRWGLDELQSGISSLWLTALLFLSGDLFGTWTLGSDLRSSLNVGLFANSLSLPVLFAFMATFARGPGRWKTAGLLLGLLILLHPLSTLIGGLFIGATILCFAWQRKKLQEWKPLIFSLVLGLGLGACWILPFLAYRSYMNPEFAVAPWSASLLLLVFNGLGLSVAALRGGKSVRILSVAYLLLINFIFIGILWKIDLQFSRLMTYLLFFIPVFILVWVRSRPVLLTLGVLSGALGLFGYRFGGIRPEGVHEFPMPDFGRVEGRILAVSPPTHLPGHHVHHELIPMRTGNASVMGLFIESSLNGRFLGNLMRSLDPDSHVWGTPTESVTPEVMGEDYAEYILERLRLFDIRYIYTDLKLEHTLDPGLAETKRFMHRYPMPESISAKQAEDLRDRYNTSGRFFDFYLYPVSPGSLAEPLPYVPTEPGSDWKLTNQQWFLQMKGVPIFTDEPVPETAQPASPGDWVAVREVSSNMDRIVLDIQSEKEIPVLVKVGYFPSWNLTLNGHSAPLYRASPNLMLLFGKGEAVLEYGRSWEEYAGLFLSGLALTFLIGASTHPFWRPAPNSRWSQILQGGLRPALQRNSRGNSGTQSDGSPRALRWL